MSTSKSGNLYGGPSTDSLENARSFGEFCYNRIRLHGDKVLFIDGLTSEKVTASQLLLRSIRVAECLQHYGIKSGDSVGICSENRFEVPYVMFAVFFIGATYVPLNPTYTERELLHACNLSSPKIIFSSHQTLDNVLSVAEKSKFVKKIFVFGDEFIGKSYASFNVFIRNSRVPSLDYFICPPQNMMENIALVFCSSGTTGMPKGVQLTQHNVWFSLVDNLSNIGPDETFLSVAPWTHIFGCYSLARSGIHGRVTVSLVRFEEEKYLQCIETFRVTILVVVPPLMVLLSKSTRLDKCDTSSLKYAISSSAPLSRETIESVQARIPQLQVRQVYGMSEAGTFTAQTDSYCKSGSIGCLRSGVYGNVIDTETGEILGPNSIGELIFKSPGIMKGYVGDSDATKASYDKDGWFHTGDIGYYDENEEWFVVDRLKELIKYNGFQVPPAELEALILTHPKVKDVGVVGLPHESAGELPMAFVVKQGDCTEKDIIDFVAKRTSPAKRLHGGVRFIDEIPKNPTGKILRRVLRNLIKDIKSKL